MNYLLGLKAGSNETQSAASTYYCCDEMWAVEMIQFCHNNNVLHFG